MTIIALPSLRLLIQMPTVTFTQFRNKLAWVVGTHQHSKGSTKTVSVSSVGAESGRKATPLKSQWKHEAKMSAQSSQIRALCSKLDSTITENSQMWEFLNLDRLQMAVTNVLQAAQYGSHGHVNNSGYRQGKPFLG